MDFLASLDLACQQHFLKLFDVLMASRVTEEDQHIFNSGLGKLSVCPHAHYRPHVSPFGSSSHQLTNN